MRFFLLAVVALLPFSSALAAESADEARARTYFTDTPLLTPQGEEVRFYSDLVAGKVVVINFIFTRCGSACPLMTSRLNQVRKSLGERFGKEITFLSISVDPRDTVEDMRRFAEKNQAVHPGWFFLTGKPENVQQVLGRLGQFVDDPEAHSTMLIAGNGRTQHWKKLRSDLPTPGLAENLRFLADEK